MRLSSYFLWCCWCKEKEKVEVLDFYGLLMSVTGHPDKSSQQNNSPPTHLIHITAKGLRLYKDIRGRNLYRPKKNGYPPDEVQKKRISGPRAVNLRSILVYLKACGTEPCWPRWRRRRPYSARRSSSPRRFPGYAPLNHQIHTGCSSNIVFFLQMLCFFLNSASSAAVLVFALPLCTHTDTEGKQREARVRNLFQNLRKNTIFNEHPVL